MNTCNIYPVIHIKPGGRNPITAGTKNHNHTKIVFQLLIANIVKHMLFRCIFYVNTNLQHPATVNQVVNKAHYVTNPLTTFSFLEENQTYQMMFHSHETPLNHVLSNHHLSAYAGIQDVIPEHTLLLLVIQIPFQYHQPETIY